MKQYNGKQELTAIVCNHCGKKIPLEHHMLKAGVFSASTIWGYFSRKDGEIHRFDLCEDCYDRLVEQFLIPPDIEEQKELL